MALPAAKRRNVDPNQGPSLHHPLPVANVARRFYFHDEPLPLCHVRVAIIVPHKTSAIHLEFRNALAPPSGPMFVVHNLGSGNPGVLEESHMQENANKVEEWLNSTGKLGNYAYAILASFHPLPFQKFMGESISTTLLEPSVSAAVQRGKYFGIITTNGQLKGTIEARVKELANESQVFRGVCYLGQGFRYSWNDVLEAAETLVHDHGCMTLILGCYTLAGWARVVSLHFRSHEVMVIDSLHSAVLWTAQWDC